MPHRHGQVGGARLGLHFMVQLCYNIDVSWQISLQLGQLLRYYEMIHLNFSRSTFLVIYSELDSFGSSTVPGHFRINIFVFPECQSIPIY